MNIILLLKALILVFSGLFIAPILIFIFFLHTITSSPPDHLRMEMYLQRDIELLTTVVEYFIDSDVSRTMFSRSSFDNTKNEISDEFVIEAMYYLFFHKNYRVIVVDPKNFVSFQKWSTLNAGRNIVYSVTGETPTDDISEFLIEVEPLSESNWYFYISDFNEWRRRNPN